MREYVGLDMEHIGQEEIVLPEAVERRPDSANALVEAWLSSQ